LSTTGVPRLRARLKEPPSNVVTEKSFAGRARSFGEGPALLDEFDSESSFARDPVGAEVPAAHELSSIATTAPVTTALAIMGPSWHGEAV